MIGHARWLVVLALLVCCMVAGSGAVAQSASPWGAGDNPAATPADVHYAQYRFRDGQVLADLRLHYATMGSPHRNATGEIDNAVLLLHWTGADSRTLQTPAYMKALFDPGRPLDRRRYFLIFADSIGHGRSSKPSDGMRMRFPNYGYRDMVDLQHRLVTETLGIRRLHAIVGMSMGGMNAWQWAEMYPDSVEGVMPVVSLPIRVSGRNLVWRHLAIDYVERDPAWQGGDYAAPFRGWVQSYQLLRMMIDGVPHLQAIAPDGPGADKFIADAAAQASGADPNDVIYSLKSSSDYDPEPGLGAIRATLFALNFGDDEFNPDSLGYLERLTPRVPGARWVVQPGTPDSFGHLTMAHPELWADHVAAFMHMLGDPAPSSG